MRCPICGIKLFPNIKHGDCQNNDFLWNPAYVMHTGTRMWAVRRSKGNPDVYQMALLREDFLIQALHYFQDEDWLERLTIAKKAAWNSSPSAPPEVFKKYAPATIRTITKDGQGPIRNTWLDERYQPLRDLSQLWCSLSPQEQKTFLAGWYVAHDTRGPWYRAIWGDQTAIPDGYEKPIFAGRNNSEDANVVGWSHVGDGSVKLYHMEHNTNRGGK